MLWISRRGTFNGPMKEKSHYRCYYCLHGRLPTSLRVLLGNLVCRGKKRKKKNVKERKTPIGYSSISRQR